MKSSISQLEFVDSANPEVCYKCPWYLPYELVKGLYEPAVPQIRPEFFFLHGLIVFLCLLSSK